MLFQLLLFCAAAASAAALAVLVLRLLGLQAVSLSGRRLSLCKPMVLAGDTLPPGTGCGRSCGACGPW